MHVVQYTFAFVILILSPLKALTPHTDACLIHQMHVP